MYKGYTHRHKVYRQDDTKGHLPQNVVSFHNRLIIYTFLADNSILYARYYTREAMSKGKTSVKIKYEYPTKYMYVAEYKIEWTVRRYEDKKDHISIDIF